MFGRAAYLVIGLMALLLTACGGDSDSGSSGSDKQTLRGKVVDPAVVHASVRLEDGEGGALAPVEQTAADGGFRFAVSAGADLPGARIYATGGRDSETGYSFRGIQWSAPVDGEGEYVVSPLSTLVVEEMKSSGAGMETARNNVAGRLGLDADMLLADPTQSASAQLAALKITRVTHVLRNAGQPMARLAGALRNQGSLSNALTALQSDSDLSTAIRDKLTRLEQQMTALNAIDTGAEPATVVEEANRVAWHRGLLRYLDQALGLTPSDQQTRDNIKALSDALWQAHDKKGVVAGGVAVRNAARHVFQEYAINPASDLISSSFSVPAAVSSDSDIVELASLDVIDHEVPLAEGEQLGFDNQARLDYYYNSDLSPFYRAEQLFTDVFDDLVMDPVYVDIARGLASVGRQDRAEVILRANIFQPRQLAIAQKEVGEALQSVGEIEQAANFWQTALEGYNDTVEAQGLQNLDKEDASFYQVLSSNYLEEDMPEKADEVMTLVEQYIANNEGEPYDTTYGRLLTSVRSLASNAVDRALADGQVTAAERTELETRIDVFRDFVDGTGYQTTDSCNNSNRHYKLKTFYITDVAKYYLRAGLPGKAEQAAQLFESYRGGLSEQVSDPVTECNRSETEVYVRFMAPVYVQLNRVDDFETMVNNTIDTGFYQDFALEELKGYYAYQDATDGKVQEALTELTNQNSDLGKRLEAFTFDGTNRRDEGLAMKLLNEGYQQEAETVMEAAWQLATGSNYINEFAPDPGALLNRGCGKMARLYHDFVSVSEGRSRMATCGDIADNNIGGGASLAERIEAQRLLARDFAYMGEVNKGLDAINAGQGLIGSMSNPMDANEQRMAFALAATANGLFYKTLELANNAVTAYDNFADSAGSDADRKDAIGSAKIIGVQLNNLVDAVEASAVEAGSLSVQEQAHVDEARDLIRGLMTGQGNRVSNGALDLVASLSDPDARNSKYGVLVERLSAAGFHGEAEAIARRPGNTEADRNEFLQTIAEAMVTSHDFGGETVLARRDLDRDGQPDFFELSGDQDERDASPLMLDGDIDGDGVSVEQDRTPFCAECAE